MGPVHAEEQWGDNCRVFAHVSLHLFRHNKLQALEKLYNLPWAHKPTQRLVSLKLCHTFGQSQHSISFIDCMLHRAIILLGWSTIGNAFWGSKSITANYDTAHEHGQRTPMFRWLTNSYCLCGHLAQLVPVISQVLVRLDKWRAGLESNPLPGKLLSVDNNTPIFLTGERNAFLASP